MCFITSYSGTDLSWKKKKSRQEDDGESKGPAIFSHLCRFPNMRKVFSQLQIINEGASIPFPPPQFIQVFDLDGSHLERFDRVHKGLYTYLPTY
jgi:hypothetical protein